jgi:hypothetical protein
MRSISFLIYCFLTICVFAAQAQQRNKPSLKDSLDGKLDLSDYIIDSHGVVPVPIIITEPALGGFGGAIAPILVNRRTPYRDSINGHLVVTPVQPDLTGGIGAYTVNGTWVAFGFRSGTFKRWRLKYLVGGGYANVNIAFYRTFKYVGEKKLQFNVEAAPIVLQGIKRIAHSRWYAGLRYVLFKASLQYEGSDTLGDLGKTLERSNLVSELGPVLELDNRDNIFTPDKGIKFHLDALRSDNIFGSDFDFWKLSYYGYGYLPLAPGLTGGLRIDGAQSTGDIPFYLEPYINMRGVPAMRYQGKATILSEGELRWDFLRRWSAITFSGVGKAFDYWADFGSANWVVSYGAGFRYLMARKFKLRMGIDLAHGADGFAYYIIFGSNWMR